LVNDFYVKKKQRESLFYQGFLSASFHNIFLHIRRTCLLKYTSRLHFAGGWITYQKDIAPV